MSIVKRKAGSKDIVKSILEFDEVPTDGSHNLVESGAIAQSIGNLGQPLQWKGPATVAQLNAGITGIHPGWTYTLTDAGTLTDGNVKVEAGDEVAWTEDDEWFQVGPSLVELKADVVQAKSDIADIQDVVPEEASESNKLVTKDELDNVQESIQSGFTPKGEISVSDLNDLTTQSNGDQYILTDSGTITDGSVTVEAGDSVAWNSTDSVWYKVKQYALSKYGTDEIKNLQTSITSFRTGDVIPVDGPSGTAKMTKDNLLKEAAQNALAGNVAPAFDPARTSENHYKAGESVVYNGKTYTFKVSHYGSWNANDVDLCPDLLMKVLTRQIFDNSGYNVSDLNSSPINSLQLVQKTASTQTANFPSDYPNGKLGILSTFKEFYNGSTFQIFQLLFVVQDRLLYRRSYNSGNNTWSVWTKSDFIGTDALSTVEFVSKYQIFDGRLGNLDDLNNAEDNTSYLIQRTENTTTLNFPPQYPISGGGTGLLTTYKAYYDGTHYQKYQILERFGVGGATTTIYRRAYNSGNNTWSAWTTHNLSPDVIKVGAGQQYTTLRAAFEAAYNAGGNQQIFVMPGTYDLSVEFSDILASITTDVGLSVGNGMHIIFADGAKVTANFVKGDLTDAQWEKLRTYFAPIWCRAGDFVIENMTIEATDCRYCVHDERGMNTTPYVHKFINCKMKKSSTTSDRIYAQCIGGGLGSHGTIVVDGGYYESNPAYGSTSTGGIAENSQCCISYHNDGYDSNSKSSVTIKNVYLANRGFFEVLDYGTTTQKTMMYISGCSFGLAPLHMGANNTATTENTEFVEWQNTQRVAGSWTSTGVASASWTTPGN